MKNIGDKALLDAAEKNLKAIFPPSSPEDYWLIHFGHWSVGGPTLRSAIENAIRASRRKPVRGGK